jgi:hypothetical protein
MTRQDVSYRAVEKRVVGGEDRSSGHAKHDLDPFVLEAAKK